MAHMTDFECVELAVKNVLERARKENTGFVTMPITGYTIMEWFQLALKEAKEIRDADPVGGKP